MAKLSQRKRIKKRIQSIRKRIDYFHHELAVELRDKVTDLDEPPISELVMTGIHIDGAAKKLENAVKDLELAENEL